MAVEQCEELVRAIPRIADVEDGELLGAAVVEGDGVGDRCLALFRSPGRRVASRVSP